MSGTVYFPGKAIPRFPVQPIGTVKTFTWDWSLWLPELAAGLTIDTSTWSIVPALDAWAFIGDGVKTFAGGGAPAAPTIIAANTKTTVTLALFKPGEYVVENVIVTLAPVARLARKAIVPVG